MANPYVSQTISGYNASPPPDDGSQVSANQLKWSNHKTKLADPIKTLSEAINTAVNTAFATVDDASNLTTGELADARLSSNVPLLDAANEFTADQKISNTSPSLQLEETDGGSDAKIWDVAVNGEILSISVRADDGSAGESLLTVSRSGSAIGTANFANGTIQVSSSEVLTEASTTVVKTTGTQTIGGAKTFSNDAVFQGSLTVNDEVITDGILTDSSSTITALTTTNAAVVRLTGTATIVSGISGGVDGRRLVLINLSGNTVALGDEAAGASAADRIVTPGAVNLDDKGSIELIYDGTSSRWRPIHPT